MLSMHFLLKAQNAAWANMCLYKAASVVSDEAYHAESPLGAISRRFEQLLLQDRTFVTALEGATRRFPLVEADSLPDSREAMETAQSALDQRLIKYCVDLDDDLLLTRMVLPLAPTPGKEAVHAVLGHLFTLQAHLRGQIQSLLLLAQVEVPGIDGFFLEQGRDPSTAPFFAMGRED